MYRRSVYQCVPGDVVEKHLVEGWPKMTDKAAVAFKRHVGLKHVDGQLVRNGEYIFEVGDADLALCRYKHTREF